MDEENAQTGILFSGYPRKTALKIGLLVLSLAVIIVFLIYLATNIIYDPELNFGSMKFSMEPIAHIGFDDVGVHGTAPPPPAFNMTLPATNTHKHRYCGRRASLRVTYADFVIAIARMDPFCVEPKGTSVLTGSASPKWPVLPLEFQERVRRDRSAGGVEMEIDVKFYSDVDGSMWVQCRTLLDAKEASPYDKFVGNNSSSGGIRLTLLHHQHRCSPFWRPAEADRGSSHEFSASLFFRRRRARPTNISVPISSAGKLYGFVAQIGLGTPPRMYSVLVDTGASFSWIQCQPCIHSCYDQDDPLFDGATSSTYRTFSCSSATCLATSGVTMSRNLCINNTCAYRIGYYDLSASAGYVSMDTLTAIGAESIPDFIFGCSQGFRPSFGRYAGIIGLGDHKFSFLSQIAKGSTHNYRAFAFYLPSPTSVGYLQVGPYDEGSSLVFTPMSIMDHLYYIELKGITVGGVPINLVDEDQVTTRPILCNVDLGAPFSVLPRRVLDKLRDAVAEQIQGYERAGGNEPLCFERQYWQTRRAVPTVNMVFRDGARFALDETKLMSEPQAGGTICLQFERGSEGFCVLGSMHLSRMYLVQDLEKSRMGFPEIF